MKKLLFSILLISSSVTVFAQTKGDGIKVDEQAKLKVRIDKDTAFVTTEIPYIKIDEKIFPSVAFKSPYYTVFLDEETIQELVKYIPTSDMPAKKAVSILNIISQAYQSQQAPQKTSSKK